MDVRLTMGERLALAALLPAQDHFDVMMTAGKLRDKLLPDDEEMEIYHVEMEGTRLRWKPPADEEPREFSFSNVEAAAIVGFLRDADKAAAIRFEHLSLYQRFVEG